MGHTVREREVSAPYKTISFEYNYSLIEDARYSNQLARQLTNSLWQSLRSLLKGGHLSPPLVHLSITMLCLSTIM